MAGDSTDTTAVPAVATKDKPPWTDLPRLDLVRRNAVTMAIFGDIRYDARVAEAIPEVRAGSEDRIGIRKYRRSRTPHLVAATVELAWIDGEQRLEIWIHYDASGDFPPSPVPEAMRMEHLGLDRVATLASEFQFVCRTTFEYPESASSELWFPLPARLSGPSDDTANYMVTGIQGFRTNDVDRNASALSFKMQRAPSGELGVELNFSISSKLTSALPGKILQTANQYAAQLVRS